MQRNFGWSKNSLTMDTVISTDNIVEIGEKLAIGSLKRLVSYRGDIALNLYRALIKDLYSRHNPNYVVSNAYDYVQIACLYLCGHIGQKLGDIVTDRHNAKVSIKHACCSEVGHWFYKSFNEHRNTRPYYRTDSCKAVDPFKEDTTEESYDKVELIISQMQLRKRTQDVLTCYINGMGVCEISKTLHICHATVWRNRMLLREKYKQVTGIEY